MTRELLKSGDVRDATEPLSVGTRTLRNVSAPVELFEGCHDHTMDKFINPVCQMLDSPGAAAATLKQEGETLYFCSTGCLKRFAAANGEPQA